MWQVPAVLRTSHSNLQAGLMPIGTQVEPWKGNFMDSVGLPEAPRTRAILVVVDRVTTKQAPWFPTTAETSAPKIKKMGTS